MPAATKRKSDGAASGSRAKKSKTAPDFTEAKDLVDTIMDGDGDVAMTPAEAHSMAEYTRWLEAEVAATKPKEKSPEDIAAAAAKLRSACVSGIKKQMSVRAFSLPYDGVCADPVIFGALVKLGGPPKWKMQKYTVAEFENFMGSIEASVRYDTLELMGNVNVRYQPDEGTFKMSGSYGAPRHTNK
ncbi:hypothetical protein C8R43DRAFT_950484 [Mycena crocata]|nr:hypothetical protein C8R43DRAFT_950484 [Mycena crocata]